MAGVTRYVTLGCCFLCTFLSWGLLFGYTAPALSQLVTAFLGLLLLMMAAIAYDFYRLLPRDVTNDITSDVTYDLKTLAVLYLVNVVCRVTGHVTYYQLVKATRHVRESQEAVLLGSLRGNQATAYGQQLGLEGIRSGEDFRQRVPLSGYDDVKRYVERTSNGEQNLLTARDVILFATTSGTTSGVRKLFPVTKNAMYVQFSVSSIILSVVPDEYFPGSSQLRKSIRLYHKGALQTSPAGVPIGPVSSLSNSKISRMMTTEPEAVAAITDQTVFSYVTWLFSLADQSAGSIMAVMASQLYTELDFLTSVWRELLADLETGRVSPARVPDEDIRRKLERALRPDRQRASSLRREFLRGSKGLLRRLWPHCGYVVCVDTGAMEVYGVLLRQTYCEGLPMYSPLYACSEAMLGVNLWPLRTQRQYLPNLHGAYIELIPLDHTHEDKPDTIVLDQAEYGREYELVLTTSSGLYRYRNGDVIKVTGFHNECPLFEFRYRIGQIIDISGEKTSEIILYDALSRTCTACGDVTLVDYTTTVSALFRTTGEESGSNEDTSGHYVILAEVGRAPNGEINAEELSIELDHTLRELSEPYSRCRQLGKLGEARVHLVTPGTFRQFTDLRCQDLTASYNQFKMPRYLNKRDAVEIFRQRLVRTSPK